MDFKSGHKTPLPAKTTVLVPGGEPSWARIARRDRITHPSHTKSNCRTGASWHTSHVETPAVEETLGAKFGVAVANGILVQRPKNWARGANLSISCSNPSIVRD
ncbi:hypothetical protein SAMD00079811_63900 [Scytonema sp. HK-05]|nr:hypothetical protein SAMD00079811_63900 [Scytonema sp. HK-05]